jgi:NAD+ synthase
LNGDAEEGFGQRMKFSREILKIDPVRVSAAIEEFIRSSVERFFKRKGIVIGLSGGIDSAVAAALSVRALGANRVSGLLLPERDSNPLSRVYGRKMAESLGIECSEVDITPVIESFGVYEKRDAVVRKLFPDLEPPYTFRLVLPQNLLDADRLNVYHIEILDPQGTTMSKRLSQGDFLELMAANDIKQRTRMTQLYYEAERRYRIVCGTTNRSEALQGFFVKYGDGGVDIEPIAPLYKTQVYQLGRFLGVPEEIIARTPSPDTYSFVVSDAEFFFCLPYDLLDLILYAIEQDVPKDEVAAALELRPDQVERAWKDLIRKRAATEHLRVFPPSPVQTW